MLSLEIRLIQCWWENFKRRISISPCAARINNNDERWISLTVYQSKSFISDKSLSDSVENRPFNNKNKWHTSLLPCCSRPCILKHRARKTNTTKVHTLPIAKTPSKLNKHLSPLSFVSSTDHDRCCHLFRPLDLCTQKHYVIAHVQYNQTQNSNLTPRVCKQNYISFYELIVSLFPVETWAQRKPNIKIWPKSLGFVLEFWYRTSATPQFFILTVYKYYIVIQMYNYEAKLKTLCF